MHIVFLSDHETRGGAAVAASRLAAELARTHCVTRLVRFPDPPPPGERHPWRTLVLGDPSPWQTWVGKVGRRFLPPRFPYPDSPAYLRLRLTRLLRRLRPDIINVHNLHGGIPWGWGTDAVDVCGDFAPTVWTLHDMWSFTGRCAYAYDCTRFRTGCDASCPTSGEAPVLAPDRIAPAWLARRHLLEKRPNLVAVTPSHWLARLARIGLWANHRVEVIPNGLPTDTFRPLEREKARRTLGLPLTEPVVLLAAWDLTERRKGGEILPGLFRHLRGLPLTVVSLGKGRLESPFPEHRAFSLGWLADDGTKIHAYNAADVLLHPAPVDNFPNVLLESLACGTPCVGFPIGGVPEILRPQKTGWLAADESAAALAGALRQALLEIARGGCLRETARSTAVAEFGSHLQATRYRLLFEALMEGNHPPAKILGKKLDTTFPGG